MGCFWGSGAIAAAGAPLSVSPQDGGRGRKGRGWGGVGGWARCRGFGAAAPPVRYADLPPCIGGGWDCVDGSAGRGDAPLSVSPRMQTLAKVSSRARQWIRHSCAGRNPGEPPPFVRASDVQRPPNAASGGRRNAEQDSQPRDRLDSCLRRNDGISRNDGGGPAGDQRLLQRSAHRGAFQRDDSGSGAPN